MTSTEIFAKAREQGLKTIRLMIYQPRVGAAREWSCSLEDLERFADFARSKACSVEFAAREYPRVKGDPKAEAKWVETFLNPQPDEDSCAFCKAMSVCPQARRKVEDALTVAPVADAFAEVIEDQGASLQAAVPGATADHLAASLAAAPFIEDWCTAVRAEAERRLLAGTEVPGFGLELGRQGARKWADPVAAEEVLRKRFRVPVDVAYNFKLKSPTQLEACAPKIDKKTGKAVPPKDGEAKPALGPLQWAALQKMVTRADPRPSVKPAKAIKTPYSPVAVEAFSAVSETPEVEDDLG